MNKKAFRTTKSKISNLICKQNRIRLPMLLIIAGIASALLGIRDFVDILQEQGQSVALFGVIEKSVDTDNILDITNVQNASMYQESVVTLQYGEYVGEFVIYGFEQEYLDLQYGEQILVDMQGEMPYVLLDANVINNLKNSSGNRIDTEKNYTLETVAIAGQNMARICGIVPMEDKEKEPCIYTNLQGFNKLVNSEIANKTQGTGNETASGSGMVGNLYVILTESGRKLDKLIEEIQEVGITIETTEELQQIIHDWREKELLGQSRFLIGCVLILCACIVFYNQLQLWKRENFVFLQWLSNIDDEEKSMKQVFFRCWMGYVRKGVLLGGVTFIIVGVFV